MAVWYIENGRLTNDFLPEITGECMTPPLPLGRWRMDPDHNDGKPYHALLGVAEALGAFKNVASLTRVRIPESVKEIGPLAFKGTSLTSVTIAEDCTCFDGSFPENCVIERYGAGDLVQLCGSDGREILGRSGQRVMVRERRTSNG